MGTRFFSTLLLTATVMTMAAGAAAEDPPGLTPPPSNTSDIGKPDPLSALDEKAGSPPPPEIPATPEFKDVSGGDTAEKSGAGANAETPPPETPEPAPAPVKKKKSKRASRPSARTERQSSAPVALAPDSPDEHREKTFHTVYEKYNAAPTPLEAWEQASASRTSEVYKVQKNDTLWDLSKTLFGDPNYWPKIWALNNDEVLNPHEIETWMQIRFYPGDLNEPPTVAVSEAPKAAAPEASKSDDAALPPPRKAHPLVRSLPPSMPVWRTEAVRTQLPTMEGVQPRRIPAVSTMALSYAVSETPVHGVGEIKETELGVGSASEFQYVFVEVNDSSNRIFTVVKTLGRLKDPDGATTYPVYVLEYQGEIEVVESVSDHGNLQRAIVRKTLAPVEVGSHIVPGRLESINVQDGAPISGPAAQIIGSQYNSSRRMTDAGGVVFLSAGHAAGMQEGMILPVFSNVRLRNPGTGARIHDREVAHVKVVKVTDNYSTAVLTKISDDVIVGDSVGGSSGGRGAGESLSRAPVAPPAGSPGEAVVPADRASAAPASGEGMDFEDPASGSGEVAPPAETPSADDDLSL